VIRFGKKAEERLIPVKLGARLTEIGTLETWCESKISDNRWNLQFELRKQGRPAAGGAQGRRGGQRAGAEDALELIREVFSPSSAKSPIAPEEAARQAGTAMGLGKNSWPLAAIRQMADAFLAAAAGRKKSPGIRDPLAEPGGFCLRPGFGYPGDDFRIEQARRIYSGGINTATRCNAKSIGGSSGAASPAAEPQPAGRCVPAAVGFLLPRGGKKPQRINAALLREMWRTAPAWNCCPWAPRPNWATRWSSASRRAITKRASCGACRAWARASCSTARSTWWCRRPPRRAGRKRCSDPAAGDALAAIARRTEDPTRDLPAATRENIRKRKLQAMPTPSACWRCSKAKRKTTARWAAFSAKNCPRGWCWRGHHRWSGSLESGLAVAATPSPGGFDTGPRPLA
jgi:hypothetical protein